MSDGLQQLRAAGQALVVHARATMKRVNQASARRTAAAMRRRLQQQTRGTGATAGAIGDVSIGIDGSQIEVAPQPGRDRMLPFWLEHGTVHMHARPFIRPSVAEARPTHERTIAADVETEIRELFTW